MWISHCNFNWVDQKKKKASSVILKVIFCSLKQLTWMDLSPLTLIRFSHSVCMSHPKVPFFHDSSFSFLYFSILLWSYKETFVGAQEQGWTKLNHQPTSLLWGYNTQIYRTKCINLLSQPEMTVSDSLLVNFRSS